MATRTGMSNVILELRGMTNAGTADATVGATTYWSDQQLQDMLDRYARQYNDYMLTPDADDINGTAIYKRYLMPPYRFEEADSGTAVWRLTNSAGSAFGTAAYSINYAMGEVTMASDQDGSAVYLTAKAFSLNRAAAEVWAWKASHYSDRYDVQTDNHRLSRSQLIRNAQAQAQHYRNEAIAERVRAGEATSRVKRIDIN